MHGSSSTGKALGVVGKLAERFPDNPQIAQALKTLKPLGTKNAITFLSGTTVDASDKSLSLASASYNHLKDERDLRTTGGHRHSSRLGRRDVDTHRLHRARDRTREQVTAEPAPAAETESASDALKDEKPNAS